MNFSIVIITKNRPSYVKKCLESLVTQRKIIYDILIIDSSSDESTKNITLKLKQQLNHIDIKYKYLKKSGYSVSRNFGIKNSRGKWVVFIDDDCILDNNWSIELKKSERLLSNDVVAVLGRTKNLNFKNVFSCVSQYDNDYWILSNIDFSLEIKNTKVLDNRNIIFNKNLLIKNNILFDEQIFMGGEDLIMGLKLNKLNLKALYNPRLSVRHQWPETFIDYFKKQKFYIKSKQSLELTNKESNTLNNDFRKININAVLNKNKKNLILHQRIMFDVVIIIRSILLKLI